MNNDSENLLYHEIPKLTKEEINLAFQTQDENLIGEAIISACKFICDYDYIINICRKFGFSSSNTIRLNILSALSLIAYNYEKIDIGLAYNIIDFCLDHGSLKVRNQAKEVREDIEHYAKLYGFFT